MNRLPFPLVESGHYLIALSSVVILVGNRPQNELPVSTYAATT